jgi:hypothetical protein
MAKKKPSPHVSAGPISGQPAPNAGGTSQPDLLKRAQDAFRLWATTTSQARAMWRRDYDFTEGGGRQWTPADKLALQKTRRPVLEFNHILPQVELVCGMQRNMQFDFVAVPRGLEDRRLGEVASAVLKAVTDFARVDRVSARVFDDATICGLGAWEVIHTFDDVDDIIWGDIVVSRISPFAFVFDPWAQDPDMQDGAFMGKLDWVTRDELLQRYPDKRHLAQPGEWLTQFGNTLGASDEFGTGYNLQAELFDLDTGRIRVMTIWHKVPAEVTFLIDTATGQVQEVPDADAGEKLIAEIRERSGRELASRLSIVRQDASTVIVDRATGLPFPDPETGRPIAFISPEAAQARLNEMSERLGLESVATLEVIKRKARVPEWTQLVWWEVLAHGPTPYRHRKYPFIPYISRRFADDPSSIFGITRNLISPQEDLNKRRSNILAHLNSSAHSGWLNRKSGGADSRALELAGSKPGVVVEYGLIPPQRIEPAQLSQGHFVMAQDDVGQIRQISGVNAELIGISTPSPATVSGRAIQARQEGGITILRPRFENFKAAMLDLARLLLETAQQFYPEEKIKRIVGIHESTAPLGPNGQSIFTHPQTGQPMTDDQIIGLLKTLRNTQFDLVLRLQPATETERQAEWERALSLLQLVTAAGKPIGPGTLHAMLDLAPNIPTRLADGLKADLAAAVQQPDVAKQQNAVLQGALSSTRARRQPPQQGG